MSPVPAGSSALEAVPGPMVKCRVHKHVGWEAGAVFRLRERSRVFASDGVIELRLAERHVRDAACGITDGCLWDIRARGEASPAGYVSLRIGESPALYYLGHIGYRVYEGFRGHGYAARAVRLLYPAMRARGLRSVVITTNPENAASRATCRNLGCVLESTVSVPDAYREICMGAAHKCRYVLMLPAQGEAR